MLVGSTGSGKTVARSILHRALTIAPTSASSMSDRQSDKTKTPLVSDSFFDFI
jgi:hypothetical protein